MDAPLYCLRNATGVKNISLPQIIILLHERVRFRGGSSHAPPWQEERRSVAPQGRGPVLPVVSCVPEQLMHRLPSRGKNGSPSFTLEN